MRIDPVTYLNMTSLHHVMNCPEVGVQVRQELALLHIGIALHTDTLSIYPWMSVSAGGWHIPSDLRQLRTEIRIGNVTIVLHEERLWSNMRNDYSSQFIAVFVATLQDVGS